MNKHKIVVKHFKCKKCNNKRGIKNLITNISYCSRCGNRKIISVEKQLEELQELSKGDTL